MRSRPRSVCSTTRSTAARPSMMQPEFGQMRSTGRPANTAFKSAEVAHCRYEASQSNFLSRKFSISFGGQFRVRRRPHPEARRRSLRHKAPAIGREQRARSFLVEPEGRQHHQRAAQHFKFEPADLAERSRLEKSNGVSTSVLICSSKLASSIFSKKSIGLRSPPQ